MRSGSPGAVGKLGWGPEDLGTARCLRMGMEGRQGTLLGPAVDGRAPLEVPAAVLRFEQPPLASQVAVRTLVARVPDLDPGLPKP